jgi:hypothetical protein
MAKPTIIPRDTFKVATTQVVHELHITGGLRGIEREARRWSLGPLLSSTDKPSWLRPLPIQELARLTCSIGEWVFGGDAVSGIGTPLVSRSWTPLSGPSNGTQTADLWDGISFNASEQGDEVYSRLARNISHSLRAVGIRLRDASDGFNNQLVAAVADGRKVGNRFTNIAATDIHLAFHSVLSELASARDYLAAALAYRLGAPPKIDAMNRFADWLAKSANAAHKNDNVVARMLAAYDSSSQDPWLYELTEYRNEFLHRSPFGTARNEHLMKLLIKKIGEVQCPVLHMPLSADDRWAPGEDALRRFVTLSRRMDDLLAMAAAAAPYESTPPHFIVSDE